MKPSIKLFLVCFALLCATNSLGQITMTYNVDSLKAALAATKEDTNRVWALNNLGRNIPNSDTVLVFANQAIALAHKLKFVKGEAEAYNNIGYWFITQGNYYKALENYLTSIRLSESVNYESGLKRSYNSIATIYLSLKDYKTSISYSKKARALSLKANDHTTYALASAWLSRSFIELNQLDSALKYAQQSYEAATVVKEPFPLYLSSLRLGEINSASGNRALAIEYLRLALRYSKQDGRYYRIAGAHQQLATEFEKVNLEDSCMYHAKQSFEMSKAQNLPASLLSSGLLLSRLYEGVNDSESLRYHKLALIAQDSLFSQEKNRQIEMLSFAEVLRQQEVEKNKVAEAEERKHNLQYAAIAIGLVAFAMIFLLLSHSIIANESLIRFLGILALLIVFEFVNLLLHPFIGDLTHHSPLLMLGFMVVIAALLIPIHHKLEKWIIHRLVEKNKKIKLQAAKKIIATMEQNGEIESGI